MERLFDQTSLIKLLKDGLKKPNPKNPDRTMWTLEDLDTPPPGWSEVVNNCKGNPAFLKVIKVSNIVILLGLKNPHHLQMEEKVELTNPKDYPTHF